MYKINYQPRLVLDFVIVYKDKLTSVLVNVDLAKEELLTLHPSNRLNNVMNALNQQSATEGAKWVLLKDSGERINNH